MGRFFCFVKYFSLLDTMVELEKFDKMRVIKKNRENQIKKNLEQCKEELKASSPPPTVSPGTLKTSILNCESELNQIRKCALIPNRNFPVVHFYSSVFSGRCGLGQMVNVAGPRTSSLTPYGTSYPYGAWGRDVKPARGDENKYWLVVLTSSNVFGHYVRQYSTLSTLLLGIGPKDTYISSSNPTTNTIQGSNMVMYANALYYNCYNKYSVCQFNLTTRAVSTVALPSDTGYNSKFPFAHLGTTYSYTDMDFVTDESGVYVIYATTSNFGNVIITKVETSNPPVFNQTWFTSLHKKTVTNTFMVCGVLYATRYLDKEIEEIFYSYDTKTNEERYDLRIHIKKMQTNIKYMNYNPRDHLLYVYSDAYIVTYEIMF
uniref:Si:ch211-194m7.5 n=1 Tax=Sinocyclocheilus anshuiensis TaxID=1608454 RepID=A0A671SU09_9TELE